MADTSVKITNQTTVKSLDSAIKFWEKARGNTKDPKMQESIDNRLKKYKDAKVKIIKYYRANKAKINAETLDATQQAAIDKANKNNFEDLTYDMLKTILKNTSSKDKVGKKDPIGFAIGAYKNSPVNLMTAVKACTVACVGGLLTAGGGLGIAGAIIGGAFALNPFLGVALGALAVSGLIKGFKKLFGKEIKNTKDLINSKGIGLDKTVAETENEQLFEEIEQENNERKDQENNDKQEKQNKINALKQKAENMKGTIYSQEDLDNLRAEMAAEGMSNDEIEQATAALNNYEEEFNAVKGNDAARGQLVDFKKEYDKVVDMISKGTVTNAQIEAAIAKLNEIANGAAELKGDTGNYKLNINETKTMAGRLVSIVNELYAKRKANEIKKGETANIKNDIEKFHGIEGLDGLTK